MLRKLLVIVLVCAVPAMQANADVRAGVDRANVEENETFRLTIVSDAEIDTEPDVSILEQHFEISTPDTRVEARIFNGQLHRSMSWSYTLRPKRSGQIVIPAISVGNEKTAPLVVDVSEVSVAIPGEAEVFITAEVDKQETYVQAQVL
ncbi:MAG: BatD family protein, partial [Pseudomonadota bacterium]